MPRVCILTNSECGWFCHQVFLLRFRTRWDKQCLPVCPNCGCLSRPLSIGWWATGLMAMKDKVPAVTTKGKDQGSQLLTSSAPLLLINFLFTISLLCKEKGFSYLDKYVDFLLKQDWLWRISSSSHCFSLFIQPSLSCVIFLFLKEEIY